jgi:hypothetical protein
MSMGLPPATPQCGREEKNWEEMGFGCLRAGGLPVWWWRCRHCGIWVWHQRGSLERALLAGHFRASGPEGPLTKEA